MADPTYIEGTTVYLWTEVRDRTGQLADAEEVFCWALAPDERVIPLTAERESVGRYSAEVVTDMPGRWHFKWQSSLPSGVDEGAFRVTRSVFP